MQMSAGARAKLTEAFEGCGLVPYRDATGVWTAGYGHTAAAGDPIPRPGVVWTKAQADQVLSRDLHVAERGVSSVLKVALTQNQFDALVDFTFNVGAGAFRSSSLLRYVNQLKFDKAANAFLAWDHSGGLVLPGLTRRRMAERAWFLAEKSFNPALAPSKPGLQTHKVDLANSMLTRAFNRALLELTL